MFIQMYKQLNNVERNTKEKVKMENKQMKCPFTKMMDENIE